MTTGTGTFTLDVLKEILREGAGADEQADLDGDILDTGFDALGYESLALLETIGRIERRYSVELDDSALAEGITPRELLALVNDVIAAAPAAA